jgi:hypothetical protein
MTGQFDRIADGEMVESRNQFEAAASTDGPGGYPEASGPDLATQHTFNEAGDRPILQLNDGWRSLTTAHCSGCYNAAVSIAAPARVVGRVAASMSSVTRCCASIRELCGSVDQSAVETIKGWPLRYRRDFFGRVTVATLLPMAAE